MSQKLVTIARYRDLPQAGLDKSRLEGQGIPCYLDNEFTIGINWLYSNALGGVKLNVAKEDVARARDLLEEKSVAEDAVVTGENLPSEAVCPECNSADIKTISYTRKFAASSLLLGLPLLFFIKRYCCDECGHRWR